MKLLASQEKYYLYYHSINNQVSLVYLCLPVASVVLVLKELLCCEYELILVKQNKTNKTMDGYMSIIPIDFIVEVECARLRLNSG